QEAHFIFQGGVDFVPKPKYFFDQEGKIVSLRPGIKVGIFSGISNPKLFREMVDSLGVEVVAEWRLADHQKGEEAQLKTFSSNCKSAGCELILTTEKDFIKISLPATFSLSIIWIEIELQLTGDGKDKWEKLVATIEEKLYHHTL
ncbi:MAG: tetraacyldisaccharide 4'-kinase, partial [Chlamydiia bacterium]|nr:tetraacyldisaccharide 4'-kinase [Chlamydiia bacterium]